MTLSIRNQVIQRQLVGSEMREIAAMHWKWALPALSILGLSTVWLLRPDELPDAIVLQTAYDREAAAGDKKHERGLKVVSAECVAESAKAYLCWIKFVSSTDSDQRLYLDAVTLARENGAWALKSGLCKS